MALEMMICIQECIVPITSSDVAEAWVQLEARLQDFGIDEIQGIRKSIKNLRNK